MAVDGRRYVIGCVHGAWTALRAEHGALMTPSYDWCEAEWRKAPADALPPVGDKRLPAELEAWLWAQWIDHGQGALF